jgi:hypothetical protein
MKRLLLLGLILLSGAAALHATEIFWDQSPPPEPTVTSDDFKMKYGSFKPAQSLEQREVYDSGQVPDLDMGKPEPERTPVAQPIRSRDTIDTPRPTERSRETTTPAWPVNRTKKQPAAPATSGGVEPAPARVEPAPSRVEPAMAPEEPAAPRTAPPAVEPRRGTPVPAVDVEPAQPEPKKLPWGQEEPQPSTDQQNRKFKWGEPK